MQIFSVSVKNLRTIKQATLTLDSTTTLIGGNNVGKSTLLLAIQLFFEPSPKIVPSDFHVNHADQPIEITITFHNFTPDEIHSFGSAILDNKLTITRELDTSKDSGQYAVTTRVHPDFGAIRSETNGTKRRTLYTALRGKFGDLPEVQSHSEIDDALLTWEQHNREQLVAERVRGFFGAINVANGKLRKKTSVHLVPAVRDVSTEISDTKRSPILNLLGDIAKQTLENRREVADFLNQASAEFRRLTDPANVPVLQDVSRSLTAELKKLYADSTLQTVWERIEGVTPVYPSPKIAIENGGVTTDISRVGHGLQRAALFAIVQFLAQQNAGAIEADKRDGGDGFDAPQSDIILLVEEPEIYQHPTKQLAIHERLKKITKSFNRTSGIRLQVLLTTHSEKFVDMRDFNLVRLIRKDSIEGELVNSVSSVSLQTCSEYFANLFHPPKPPMTDAAFAAKMHIFSREVCEGFFASKVVLVEGVTDKAVLDAAFRSQGRNPNDESISIISVDGKTKMDKPFFVFRRLGIPTFMIFDNDSGKGQQKQKRDTNLLLQKLCDIDEPVDFPEGGAGCFWSLPGTLESHLAAELEGDYDSLLQGVAENFGLALDEIKKTPAAMSSVFVQARGKGHILVFRH